VSKPIHLAILCGGQTTEHNISIISAKNIAAGFDKKRYRIYVVYINHQGEWWLIDDVDAFIKETPPALCKAGHAMQVTLSFGDKNRPLQILGNPKKTFQIDCFFPVFHGPMGEDGTMQGLLELLQQPYIGPGVLGCALSMHKGVAKELMLLHDLPVVPWVEIRHHELRQINYETLAKEFGETLFIKPVHLGSSVGIHKVSNENEWQSAIEDAFRYDDSVLVETAIEGRELECAVLGNENPQASLPAEIITSHEFYTYDAKYIDPKGAETIAVADVPEDIQTQVREYAIQTFDVLRCVGMLRVDFFLQDDGQVFINEVNPIPGFTDISMYPKMWEASGLAYSELLNTLVRLALEHYQKQHSYVKIYQSQAQA